MDNVIPSELPMQDMQSAFSAVSAPFGLYKSLDNKVHDAAVRKNEEQERINQQVADAMAIAPSGQEHDSPNMEF